MAFFSYGVANSISANFQYDPADTIHFAQQGNFEILQVYLNEALLNNAGSLKTALEPKVKFKDVYYHAEGFLNQEFSGSDYRKKLYRLLERANTPQYIIHFDERENIDKLIRLVDALSQESPKIFIENYFIAEGKSAAEKNLKKFLALFTLSTSFGSKVYPVLDIPRLFHQKCQFSEAEGLEWCYQILNFFGNRNIPLLLHIVDYTAPPQSHTDFTTVGKGYIPYQKIFDFIRKTRPLISGIVFEFEDKINPLLSRDSIESMIGNKQPAG
jgi:hypothetical protein